MSGRARKSTTGLLELSMSGERLNVRPSQAQGSMARLSGQISIETIWDLITILARHNKELSFVADRGPTDCFRWLVRTGRPEELFREHGRREGDIPLLKKPHRHMELTSMLKAVLERPNSFATRLGHKVKTYEQYAHWHSRPGQIANGG